MPKTTSFDWRLYRRLLSACLLSLLLVFPYLLTLQEDILREIDLPLMVVLVLSFLQTGLLLALLIFLGLKMARRVGLGFAYWGKNKAGAKPHFSFFGLGKRSVATGLTTGAAIIALDFFFIEWGVELLNDVSIPIWQGFLASFYGGIVEEVLLRLFLMTFIVWLIDRFCRSTKKTIRDRKALMWLAIVFSAILFGLGHLPTTAALTPLTPLVIFRAIVLNGVGGVVFGWLYWRQGLESAMMAHFSTDLVLHVFWPFILLIQS